MGLDGAGFNDDFMIHDEGSFEDDGILQFSNTFTGCTCIMQTRVLVLDLYCC